MSEPALGLHADWSPLLTQPYALRRLSVADDWRESPGAFHVVGAGSDPRLPIELLALLPRDFGGATTVCAGVSCRTPVGAASQVAPYANASSYSAFAAGLEVAVPNQLRSLPAPESGWVDLGYTPPGSPTCRQMLAVMCEHLGCSS